MSTQPDATASRAPDPTASSTPGGSECPDHDAPGHRLDAVHRRIEHARRRANRDDPITLIAVSKGQPLAAIVELFERGQADFGENYPQEFCDKFDRFHDQVHRASRDRVRRDDADAPAAPDPAGQTADRRPRWHFIGQIQRNKTRLIAERADVVHSVDRAVVAERLARQRPVARGPLDVLIQVDVSREPGKGGAAPGDLDALVRVVRDCPNLRLAGLMTVPAPNRAAPDAAAARAPFATLRRLRDRLQDRHPGLALPWLSMGMSNDLEAAILEGATHVRVGTALFGPRTARGR